MIQTAKTRYIDFFWGGDVAARLPHVESDDPTPTFSPLFPEQMFRGVRNYTGLSGGPCAAACQLVGQLYDAVTLLVDPDVRAPVYS